MPFDGEGNLLLPATTLSHELWPMLLTKALLKVAALELVACVIFQSVSVSVTCYGNLRLLPLVSPLLWNFWIPANIGE